MSTLTRVNFVVVDVVCVMLCSHSIEITIGKTKFSSREWFQALYNIILLTLFLLKYVFFLPKIV